MGAVRNSNTRASHASVEMRDVKSGASNTKAEPDSPRALADGADRRPSFSYLRRASDRRRRRRLRSGANLPMDDLDATGLGSPTSRGHFEFPSRGRVGQSRSNSRQEQTMPKLRIEPDQQDEDSREQAELWYDVEDEQEKQTFEQDEDEQMDQQRCQSVNDRLADAVSDVIDFVRDESFKRHKRRSNIRRRTHQTGSNQGTDEQATELDSEGPAVSGGERAERAESFRRRRIMRRSPRRHQQAPMGMSRQATVSGAYNDSDTGSGTSLAVHPTLSGAVSLDQVIHPPYQQMPKRQMSAAYPAPQASYSLGYATQVDSMELERSASELPARAQVPLIPVGSSPPPPPPGSVGAELAAARRRRDEMEMMGADLSDDSRSLTGIHLEDPMRDPASVLTNPTGSKDESSSPVRFVAPKVAPLQSPSAVPQEADLVFRGRRLPQIPGSSIFKTAADFVHSSIHGTCSRQQLPKTIVSGSFEDVEFPLVSDSPTNKPEYKEQQQPTRAIVKRQQSEMDRGSMGELSGQSIQFPQVSYSPTPQPVQTVRPGSSFHTASQFHVARNVPTASTSVQSACPSAQSMIATHQDGTRSTVLAPSSSNPVDPRSWVSLTRRSRRDNDGNEWF